MPPFDAMPSVSAGPEGALLQAAELARERALAVLSGRVELFADPLFNPAVALLAAEHEPAHVVALSERLTAVPVFPLDPWALEGFYADEWVEPDCQGPHWIALRLAVGEAGGIDYGEAYCAVNTRTYEVCWLDPDGPWAGEM